MGHTRSKNYVLIGKWRHLDKWDSISDYDTLENVKKYRKWVEEGDLLDEEMKIVTQEEYEKILKRQKEREKDGS